MIGDLFSFYSSKQWRLFTLDVRNSRLNDQGLNICEHCGKPIINKYDCIAHHKEELKPENVNDINVAFNPDNIMLVHHKCHNIIHDKLGYTGRKVYIVYGAPLSGKTSWVNSVHNKGDLIVDMDNIWECVSGCDRYIKPNRLKGIVFTVRNELLNAIKYRRGKWVNAYVIGGYPLSSERDRLINELQAEEIFIDSTKDDCLKRLYQANDRDLEEWTTYIEDWYRKYTPPLT